MSPQPSSMGAAGLGHRETRREQMTTDDETKAKRTRRTEPISRRNAKNGAVTYTFQVDIGARPDGSRERQRITFPTFAEARREYRRITTEVAAGIFVRRDRTTVGEYSTKWLDRRRDRDPTLLRDTDIRLSRLPTTSAR